VRIDVPELRQETRIHAGRTVQLTLAAALIGLVAACGEGTAPRVRAGRSARREADQLGAMVDTEFGVPAPAATATLTANGFVLADLTTTRRSSAEFWGRLRVVPAARVPFIIATSRFRATPARVEHDVTFEGLFWWNTTCRRPLQPDRQAPADRMTQRAVLVRDRSDAAGWRAVQVLNAELDRRGREPETVTVSDVRFIATTRCSSRLPIPASWFDRGQPHPPVPSG